jgi:3-deoxy-D-manno-octulosonic-acid transferase
MKFIIDCVYLLAAVAITPTVVYRMVRYGRYRAGWSNRFGRITRKDPALKKCIWLHAVSLGEVNAAKTLVKELENRFSNFEIVISTTTDTGFARAAAVFGANYKVFYFPLDFSCIMRRAFHGIQPAICLLMELEVWPNFVLIADQLNTPVIVVNGRMSDKSFSRYKKIKPFAKEIFRKLSLVLAQTDEYAQRFIEIGCPPKKVFVTGSLKYDTAQITDKVEGADTLAEQLFGKIENRKSKIENPLWVAGATGNDEEQILLDVYKNLREQFSNLRLAIVPRKPERFNEVADLIMQSGFGLIRYSEIKGEATEHTEKKIINHKSSIINSEDLAGLKQSLSWRYPFGDAPLLPAKRSVTQFTHRNDEFAKRDYSMALGRMPKIVLQTQQVDGLSLGTAAHLVISQLDLNQPITEEAIKRVIHKLVTDGAIAESVASLVDADSIMKFFESDLGQNALDKNNKSFREWPFTFAIPASQWLESETHNAIRNTHDVIIVQGIIDLLIKTPNGLLVIDFKNVDVPADQLSRRTALYRRQLDIYAEAAEAITGEKVKGKWLYFLKPACAIQV